EFSAPRRWDMDKWVSKRAAERGIRIDKEAATLLVDLIGEDLRALDGELTKLELFLGTGAPVGVSAVEEVVGRRRGESVWDLPRRLLEGDAAGAQVLAGRLLGDGENPVHLVSVTTQVVLDAWRIRIHLEKGSSRGNIIEEVGLNRYFADANIAAAERIPAGTYPRMIGTLKECDLALKSSATGKETLIQAMIARLAVLSRANQTGSNVS
ncbi:DNA polymerase III subunit delta, partial [Gemmatimonadota bacterium]